MDYIQNTLGITVEEGENALKAFRRHAKKEKWHQLQINQLRHELDSHVAASVQSRLPGSSNKERLMVLLKLLGVQPAGDSSTKCRAAVKNTFINIYDFEAGQYQHTFATRSQLGSYTKKKKLIFPKEIAKQGATKFLLQVFSL